MTTMIIINEYVNIIVIKTNEILVALKQCIAYTTTYITFNIYLHYKYINYALLLCIAYFLYCIRSIKLQSSNIFKKIKNHRAEIDILYYFSDELTQYSDNKKDIEAVITHQKFLANKVLHTEIEKMGFFAKLIHVLNFEIIDDEIVINILLYNGQQMKLYKFNCTQKILLPHTGHIDIHSSVNHYSNNITNELEEDIVNFRNDQIRLRCNRRRIK